MNTLTSPPLNSLLPRIFAEAEESMAIFRKRREELRAQGFGPEALELAAAAREAHMAVLPETATLLYQLVRIKRPKLVIEFGASFGVSTLHLAAGLQDNGEGFLVTTEMEANKVDATQAMLDETGLACFVELRQGDALKTLNQDLPGPVDFLFLDGKNNLYLDILELLRPKLSSGAIILADNAQTPGYRDHMRSDPDFASTPIDDRVELSILA